MLKSYPKLKFSFVEFSLTHMTFPAILAQTDYSLKNRAAVSTAISWAANTLRMSTDSTESKAKFYSDRSSLELPWNAAYDLALLAAQYFQLFVVACAPLPQAVFGVPSSEEIIRR
jgi:hypothetical protein